MTKDKKPIHPVWGQIETTFRLANEIIAAKISAFRLDMYFFIIDEPKSPSCLENKVLEKIRVDSKFVFLLFDS